MRVNPHQVGEQKTSVFLRSSRLSSSIPTFQQIQGAPSKPRPPCHHFSAQGAAGTLGTQQRPGRGSPPPAPRPCPPFPAPRQGHPSESPSGPVSPNLAGPFSPGIRATLPTTATSPGKTGPVTCVTAEPPGTSHSWHTPPSPRGLQRPLATHVWPSGLGWELPTDNAPSRLSFELNKRARE